MSAWEEALPRMAVGDKWEVYAPSELAYGDDGMEEASGAVAPGEAVVYVLELLSMEGAGAPRKPPPRDAAAEAAAEADADAAEAGGAGPLRRLRDVQDLRAWAEEAGEQRTLVLALLRAPSSCVLRKAVAAAAMTHGPGGRAAFAFSSESAFVPSVLERGLGLAAPAVSQHGRNMPSWQRQRWPLMARGAPALAGGGTLGARAELWPLGARWAALEALEPCRGGAERRWFHDVWQSRSTFRPTVAPLGLDAPCCSRRHGATRRRSRSRPGRTRAGVPRHRP